MAQYLVLLYEDEKAYEDGGEELLQQVIAEHEVFSRAHDHAVVGGNELQPTSTATSIRRDASGEVVVTDGPFAETKEALGGYYVLEAADLDEALAVAREIPARFGGVEVRPLQMHD